MPLRLVQSRQNAHIKELRGALQRPGRSKAEAIGLEGVHLVREAALSGLRLTTVFVAQGHESLLSQLSLPSAAELLAVPAEILASAVTTEAPQAIAALAQPPSWGWQDLLTPTPLLVLLAGLQDPGNLGTILRSSEAFGASGVVALPGTVSPWNAKA
ncbi:MAG TPA: TrmH family RNA methyltransferase, partial [Acidobacteriaceae bacterium]